MGDNKSISIIGTNNRYQIKKLTETKQISTRKTFKNIDMIKYPHEVQKHILSKLNCELLENANIEENSIFVMNEIKHKLTNYKQQDLLKKIFNDVEFISLEDTIELLNLSNLVCHYCSQDIYILYEIVREQMQWTLDRIDNSKGHNKNNVVISCLKCNLNRRCTSKDAFMFTKKLNITKSEPA